MLRKELIKKLKPYWKELDKAEEKYCMMVQVIENKMQQEVREDLEFFWSDGWAGIGNNDRSMKLIHREELE
jgi:hypothetical protein